MVGNSKASLSCFYWFGNQHLGCFLHRFEHENSFRAFDRFKEFHVLLKEFSRAMAVGDHFAVLIRGALAANFRKGEKSREEITDLMAGGEAMAELEAAIATHSAH